MVWTLIVFIYQNENYSNLEGYEYVKVDYSFKGKICPFKVYFIRGMEMYIYEVSPKNKNGSIEFSISSARLFPTRGKPGPQPITIVSECDMNIRSIEVR